MAENTVRREEKIETPSRLPGKKDKYDSYSF